MSTYKQVTQMKYIRKIKHAQANISKLFILMQFAYPNPHPSKVKTDHFGRGFLH